MNEEARHRRAAPKRVRLDVTVVERGLESSRERARRLIVAGEVTVDGAVTRAPSTLVARDAAIALGKTLPYVSRGGLKLAHALDRFGIDVTGRVCLDAGASTGGFTDVLLQRGAQRVYAVDVGKGLLAWSLRQNPRVVVMEEVNVRYLRLGGEDIPPSGLASTANAAPTLPERVDLAVVDVAFISLRLVLPAITGVLAPDGDLVALVKPQFEAGQADVGKGGVVRDPRVHRRVLEEALDAVRAQTLHPRGLTASPIRGQAGNVEFLLWASASAHFVPFDDAAAIAAALAEVPR
jgi:23S rRNA (cytidine1920-2'-O)/16S rRNA (cytidine1409-2'-O)-methyltransferase